MDTTIRNLDEKAYRALKAQAATVGKTVGEAVNEAIRAYLARPGKQLRNGSLRDLKPEAYPAGNETLSDSIDDVVYGRGPQKAKRAKRR
jgi:plasmid stability protein